MKITQDVNYAGMRPAGNVSTRTTVSSSNRSSDLNNQLNNQISAKIQRDKSMIDALAIAQTSRMLVQKAIDISARLRAIAFQAMTSGSVDIQELGSQVAEIQGTMQSYGEAVSVPVSSSRSSNNLSDELLKLATASTDMSSGRKVTPEFFAGIDSNLKGMAAETDTQIKSMTSALGVPGSSATEISGLLPIDIAGLIKSSPDTALKVQGNINPEVVRAVTSA